MGLKIGIGREVWFLILFSGLSLGLGVFVV